jgi:hypothetical protein
MLELAACGKSVLCSGGLWRPLGRWPPSGLPVLSLWQAHCGLMPAGDGSCLAPGPAAWTMVWPTSMVAGGAGLHGELRYRSAYLARTPRSACWRPRVRAKRFAVLVRPKDVRLIPPVRRQRHTGTIGLAAAGMMPWPCPGGHRCAVRGFRRPGGRARRCGAPVRCCPGGIMVSGSRVWWSCPAVLVPRVAARVLRRGPR